MSSALHWNIHFTEVCMQVTALIPLIGTLVQIYQNPPTPSGHRGVD